MEAVEIHTGFYTFSIECSFTTCSPSKPKIMTESELEKQLASHPVLELIFFPCIQLFLNLVFVMEFHYVAQAGLPLQSS